MQIPHLAASCVVLSIITGCAGTTSKSTATSPSTPGPTGPKNPPTSTSAPTAASSSTPMNASTSSTDTVKQPSVLGDFRVHTLEGDPVSLGDWKGKVVLVVNTASACGYTPQYAGLEKLHQELAPRGFAVLGFPCNEFGGQEPGDPKEIRTF